MTYYKLTGDGYQLLADGIAYLQDAVNRAETDSGAIQKCLGEISLGLFRLQQIRINEIHFVCPDEPTHRSARRSPLGPGAA